MNKLHALSAAMIAAMATAPALAEDKPADMSDPMAVYTQGGFSYGTNGVNLKMGKTLDTGSPTEMGMVILELKDMMGDATDEYGSSKNDTLMGDNADASPDKMRFRYFGVNQVNGRGKYVDFSHNFNTDMGLATVGLMQALPKVGNWQAFPILAGGVIYSNGDLNDKLKDMNVSDEVDTDAGINAYVGQLVIYQKYVINDKIWLNWNPAYTHAFAGDDFYTDGDGDNVSGGFDGIRNSEGLVHEFIASYQMTPRDNLRMFFNTSHNNFGDGDMRLEYNHQF